MSWQLFRKGHVMVILRQTKPKKQLSGRGYENKFKATVRKYLTDDNIQ